MFSERLLKGVLSCINYPCDTRLPNEHPVKAQECERERERVREVGGGTRKRIHRRIRTYNPSVRSIEDCMQVAGSTTTGFLNKAPF